VTPRTRRHAAASLLTQASTPPAAVRGRSVPSALNVTVFRWRIALTVQLASTGIRRDEPRDLDRVDCAGGRFRAG